MSISKTCMCETPILSATLQKNQAPIVDTLGPFPDEPILNGLDRLLYLMGAQRIQRLLNLPTPLDCCSSNSQCVINCEVPPSCCSSKPVCCTIKSPCRASCCAKCCQSSKQRTTQVDFDDSIDLNEVSSACSGPSIGQRLKRSFSLCSLACRRLKNRMAPSSTSGSKCGGPKWLWTRLVCQPNGCKIYEVYKNSNGHPSPNSVKCKNEPVIIFVVLPNGYIMPFESLAFH